MTHYFYRLQIQNLLAENEAECVDLGFRYQATGSSEALHFSQPDLTFDPRIHKAKYKNIDLFFDTEPAPELGQIIREQFPQVSITLHKEEHKDWLAEWKKGFRPFCLTDPYWIVPSWLESPVTDSHAIRIDPGMAFGTGTHATTQLAAYLVKKQMPLYDKALVLDVGTGTGILAILAEKLGADTVVGTDIDPECIRVARENLEINHCQCTWIDAAPIQEIRGQFDIVIANIIDGILVKLRKDLINKLKTTGTIIVSGILSEREDYFIQDFIETSGLKVETRIEKEGWIAFALTFISPGPNREEEFND